MILRAQDRVFLSRWEGIKEGDIIRHDASTGRFAKP